MNVRKKENFTSLKKVNKWLRSSLKPHLRSLMGFTLIEIVISLAIIGISIVTILQLFSGGLRSIKVSDDYLRATILARNKISALEFKFSNKPVSNLDYILLPSLTWSAPFKYSFLNEDTCKRRKLKVRN